MRDFISDFQERVEDIFAYIQFVELLDQIETYKNVPITLPAGQPYIVTADLQKNIRANCYLLLYNLVESTIRNCIVAIHDEIQYQGLNLQQLNQGIQTIFLENTSHIISESSKKNGAKKLHDFMQNIVSNSPAPFNYVRIPISGNLDYITTIDLLKKYEVYVKYKGNREKLKQSMSITKERRNKLAHGNVSFRNAVRDRPISDIKNDYLEIKNFLEAVVKNVDEYLDKSAFKTKSA